MSDDDVRHIYGLSERLFTECGNPKMSYETSVITYMNGLNDSVIGTNTAKVSFGTSKNTLKKYEYDDFGKTNDIRSGFGYNGEELDDNGLIYLRARYYNPELGRFIQIDSFKGIKENIESQNRYVYTQNNPYKYIDKSGNIFGIDDAGAAIGAGIVGIGVLFAGTVAWVQSGGSKSFVHSVSEIWNNTKTNISNAWDDFQSSQKERNRKNREAAERIKQNNATYTYVDITTTSSWAYHAAEGGVKGKTYQGGKSSPRPWKTLEQMRKELCDQIQNIYKTIHKQEEISISKSVAVPTNPAIPDIPVIPPVGEVRDKLKEKTGNLSDTTGLTEPLIKIIRRVIELNKRDKRPDSHHIVPWKYMDRNKVPESIIILHLAEIDYKYGPENRVDLPTSFHHPIHTNAYTTAVYYYISPEYDAGLRGFQLYPHVTRRLNDIRTVLKIAATIAMPF